MSIKDLWGKIKGGERMEGTGRSLYLIALILVMSSLSFGLGRLSALEQSREAVKIELPPLAGTPAASVAQEGSKPPQAAPVVVKSTTPTATSQVGAVIASRSGTKYHFLHCPSGKAIKPENKITFNSEAAAQAAGYTLAKNCK